MGRSTQGVRGIKLRDDDYVISAAQDGEGDEVLLMLDSGYGKRTKMEEFPKQKRGGYGVKAVKPTANRGQLVAARALTETSELFVMSSDGIVIRTNAESISLQKRAASGVKVMNTEGDATVTSITLVPSEDE